MKGHVFLKVTGILMIIAAAFSIIVGVLLAVLAGLWLLLRLLRRTADRFMDEYYYGKGEKRR